MCEKDEDYLAGLSWYNRYRPATLQSEYSLIIGINSNNRKQVYRVPQLR